MNDLERLFGLNNSYCLVNFVFVRDAVKATTLASCLLTMLDLFFYWVPIWESLCTILACHWYQLMKSLKGNIGISPNISIKWCIIVYMYILKCFKCLHLPVSHHNKNIISLITYRIYFMFSAISRGEHAYMIIKIRHFGYWQKPDIMIPSC